MHKFLCFICVVICGLSAAVFGDRQLVMTEEAKQALVDHHNKLRSEVRDVFAGIRVIKEKLIPEMSA